MTIDASAMKAWIGRSSEAEDMVSTRLIDQFRATLGPHIFPGCKASEAPPALHWCLAPASLPMAELGEDGLPAETGLIPAVPLPRRMWAGGEIESIAPLEAGKRVQRRSRIADVTVKEGRSGTLLFVSVMHEYADATGSVAIRDRQDIVFREAAPAGAAARPQADVSKPATAPAPDLAWTVDGSTPLLFRYSAITFNAHRIHYDAPYARDVEGYAGLLVHGPLQASLLLNLAATLAGRVPRRFAYRGVAPLVAGAPFRLSGRRMGEDRLACTIEDEAGLTTMTAEVTV